MTMGSSVVDVLGGRVQPQAIGARLVSHAFSRGFDPQHTERRAAYWAEALGGSTTYSAAGYDETSVVPMHSGTVSMRRWTVVRSTASTRP